MEPGFDFVKVMDKNYNLSMSYTGYYENIWKSIVNGNKIIIEISSDYSIQHRGFKINKYLSISAEHSIGEVSISLSNGEYTAITNTNGYYTINNVSSGRYLATLSSQYWTFSPTSRFVNVVQGLIEQK